MPGLGTVLNVGLIILGSVIGLMFRQGMKESLKSTLMVVCGLIIIFIGLGGTIQKMFYLLDGALQMHNFMMLIISLVIGAVIGEWIDLDGKIAHFGEWLKIKTGNSGDVEFTNVFITASLTFTIGAMGFIGAIEDGINGNYTILLVKGVIDGIIVMVMCSSMGKGALFSFIPVGVVQILITMLAYVLEPFITVEAMNNLSYVGSILIFCVGLNLLWPNKVKVANLLPAIFIAMALSYVPWMP